MIAYFAEFRIVGEVADFLYLSEPAPRLLVDLSLDPPSKTPSPLPPSPRRIATEIPHDTLAGQFLRQCQIGDIVEFVGTLSQNGYQAHGTDLVDTVLSVSSFHLIGQEGSAQDLGTAISSATDTVVMH